MPGRAELFSPTGTDSWAAHLNPSPIPFICPAPPCGPLVAAALSAVHSVASLLAPGIAPPRWWGRHPRRPRTGCAARVHPGARARARPPSARAALTPSCRPVHTHVHAWVHARKKRSGQAGWHAGWRERGHSRPGQHLCFGLGPEKRRERCRIKSVTSMRWDDDAG